ncbi:MAG: hypothetical protein JOZ44_13275, partial [Acidobacteria bacterium]|nr:hypothetical protein [Acidobacteriota bacterium]
MLTRRDFGLRSLGTALLLPFLRRFSQAAGQPSDSQNGFPAADYTPYGYLDNPYHSWALNRSGVLRSCRGIGFGWHYPVGPGGYFDEKKNGIYSTFLRLGFQIGDRRLWEMEDFHAGELRCVHHSTRLMQHEVRVAGTQFTCTFAQVGEHALAVRIERTDANAIPIVVLAAHRYELGNSEWWGGDGVVGEWRATDNCLVTRSFAAGTVFAIGSNAIPQKQMFYSGEGPFSVADTGEKASQTIRYAHDPLQGALAFSLARGHALDICIARGANRNEAVKEMRRALSRVSDEIDAKKKSDSAFWNSAPQLEGDWPQHWKNGWVYDFETLRMIVRRPIGVYR